MIKDSGERTRFDTGAVRDMHTGKGRMDLLPWEALVEVSKHCEEGALKYGERNCEKGIPIHSLIDSAFRHLAKYMIASVKVKVIPGEDGNITEREVKTYDKLKALELLGKHLGMFTDKLKMEGNVPVVIMGDDQLED